MLAKARSGRSLSRNVSSAATVGERTIEAMIPIKTPLPVKERL